MVTATLAAMLCLHDVLKSLDKRLDDDPDFVPLLEKNSKEIQVTIIANRDETVVTVVGHAIPLGLGTTKRSEKDHNSYRIATQIALYRALLNSRENLLEPKRALRTQNAIRKYALSSDIHPQIVN